MSDEPRSAAAMAGHCDEQLLVMNVLAALVGAHSGSAAFDVWMTYVRPREKELCPETIEDLEHGMLLCFERIAKPRR